MMRKWIVCILVIFVITLSGCKPKSFTASINPSLDTVLVGSTWVDEGCETDGDTCITIEENVDVSKIGVYEVIYEATKKDKSIYLKRVVTVVDIFPPVISLLPGIDTIKINGSWIDAGCTAVDNYDDSVTCTVKSNTLNTGVVGEYIITYTSTDDSGNTTTTERHVFVVE